PLAVIADHDALERILLNLVENAVQHGGTNVRVSATHHDARAIIVVEDDGVGIAAEHLPRLFERFYRVDAGRSREHGGAGLGLAIVKHLVESMDGKIEVESEVGRGTRFVVTLPTPRKA